MKVLDVKVLRGPNFWSIKRQKLIQFTIDLEELEEKPTNQIPGFLDRLQQLLPSLYEHECSEGHPGGFFERVKSGTWMGHVIEHIALELQSLAGMDPGFGRTRGTGKTGVYHVAYEYDEEAEGRYAGEAAIRLVEAIIAGSEFDVKAEVEEIKKLWYRDKVGPSTGSIVEEAKRRNIPVIRLDDNSLIQLGYGSRQKRIEATLTCNTGIIAVDIAGNKATTKKLLRDANVPVPLGEVITCLEELKEIVESVGYPVVIKPLDGNHGKGATININDWDHALVAFKRAKDHAQNVLIEKYIEGDDYRVLVINNKFVAAARRTPAFVRGDGRSTIQQLVDEVNKDPRRGECHEKVLTSIKIDAVTRELLEKNKYDLETILPEGEVLYLKPTANLSTGGTATDVTDIVHPSNIPLFERIARTVGLDICGIDIITTAIQTPIVENGGAVIEVNAAPGFRMHVEPTYGRPRNVAKPVIDMLFPDNKGRIPIIAITGTNGKTTTTRLTAHIARQSGLVTGYTTTDGIYIDNELVLKGDCAGPASAQFILKDSSIEMAVLETARGGILRSGLGFDQCDCAIITNIAEDHLGLDGIDSIEKLAKVKSVVAEAVAPHGYAILNADDDLVYAMKDNVKCKVALFSMYSDNLRVEDHCAKGGLAAVYENGYLLLRLGRQYIPVEEVSNLPFTFGGKAEFNIANALAAALACYVSRIRLGVIRDGLKSFRMSNDTTPGRLNIYEFNEFSVLLDYAHNAHGVKALGKFIKSFEVQTRTGVITGVGDRRDEDIIALAEEAARIFDEIIIRHDDDLRGRTHEELDKLLTEGVKRVDRNKPISYCWDELEAAEKAIVNAKPGALIVVLTDNIKRISECIQQYQEMDQKQLVNLKKAV